MYIADLSVFSRSFVTTLRSSRFVANQLRSFSNKRSDYVETASLHQQEFNCKHAGRM